MTNRKKAAEEAASKNPNDVYLTGNGMGEVDDFLSSQNHLFINKLNFICKNYDESFKDVTKVKRILEE